MSKEIMKIDDFADMFEAQKANTLAAYGVLKSLEPMSEFSISLMIAGSLEVPERAITKALKELFREVAYRGHKPYSSVVVTEISSPTDSRDLLVSVKTIKDL